MTTTNESPNEKKLSSIRKILWLCFAAFAIPTCLCTSLLLLQFPVRNPDSPFQAEFIIMAAGPILLIGVIGIVCLVIYNIMKIRLEKNEDLFL